MNQAIGDKAAIAFAIGFYQALGAGRTIEEAYQLEVCKLGYKAFLNISCPFLLRKGKHNHSRRPVMVGGAITDPASTTEPDVRFSPHPAPEYTGCCHQHHNVEPYHHGLTPVPVGWQSFGYTLRFSVRQRRLP